MKRLFIANRGEIAARIIRTADRLKIETVVPYVPAEKKALFRKLATRSVLIPPNGYLDAKLMVELALKEGADALHPGYGYLSERAEFSEVVEKAGLIFVGPSPNTMRLLGEKSSARQVAQKLGIPVAAGYDGDDQSDAHLAASAKKIGFPILIKAAAGGGGRGMRLVRNAADLESELISARREALAGFGDGKLLLERFFEDARHVEVQILGDGKGEVRHLFDRDCTIQRRYQKLIEEAPAPNLPDTLRKNLFESAVKLGREAQLRGVSTVEFLVSAPRAEFIFLEVNCRLQVEHTVTEEAAGIDLVEAQLRIAQNESLDAVFKNEPVVRGCAIEARIVAEDPDDGFAPSFGTIGEVVFPAGVRVEHSIEQGTVVGPEFDSLLAKIIVTAPDRAETILKLRTALERTKISGVKTNISLLKRIAFDPAFESAEALGGIIGRTLNVSLPANERRNIAEQALTAFLRKKSAEATTSRNARLWQRFPEEIFQARIGGAEELFRTSLTFESDGIAILIEPRVIDGGGDSGGPLLNVSILSDTEVLVGAHLVELTREYPKPPPGIGGSTGSASITAPLPGRIVAISASLGQAVREGDQVAVLESMKMEHSIRASSSGVVAECLVKVGDNVNARQEILRIAPEPK